MARRLGLFYFVPLPQSFCIKPLICPFGSSFTWRAGRHLGEARHGHHVAGERHQEARARAQAHLAHADHEVARRP